MYLFQGVVTLVLHFTIIKPGQVEKVKKSDPNAKVVWVNRLHVFKPNPEVVARYKDILRRYGTHPNATKYAAQGSNYDANYRMRLTRDSKSIAELRKIAVEAKENPVYLVSENDMPDIGILIDIATRMTGSGVWR